MILILGLLALPVQSLLPQHKLLPKEICSGKALEEDTFSFDGQCHEIKIGSPNDTLRSYQQGSCTDSVISLALFQNSTTCSGKTVTSPAPAGLCIHGNSGQPELLTCHGTYFTRKRWSFAPDVPENVQCVAAGHGSLRCSCEVSSAVDQVSFEVSLPVPLFSHFFESPTLSYTVYVELGKASATIQALLPSTEYSLRVRAHRRGQNQGNPESWSVLSHEVSGMTGSEAVAPNGSLLGLSSSKSTSDAKNGSSRWLEIYRFAEREAPDFLDGHNAGDLTGVPYWRNQGPGVLLTRYCVQVQSPLGSSVESSEPAFAKYASCNRGQCRCMLLIDRALARQPKEEIMNSCGHSMSGDPLRETCHCSRQTNDLMQHYVGRQAIRFPLCFPSNDTLHDLPDYPEPHDEDPPDGYWFSFPTKGQCKVGDRLGENCTWRLDSASHSVKTAQTPLFLPKNGCFDAAPLFSRASHARNVFDRLDLPPCGES